MILIIFIFNLLTSSYPEKPNKIDSLPIVVCWKYDENKFYEKIPCSIDTLIQNFYNYNPANLLKSYIFNSNIGTPLLSNSFYERKYFNFFFFNFYFPYLFTNFNDFYINTRKPFSKIKYINGGPSSAKEESIDVIHSQNINPFFNFGLNFFSGSSQGYLQWNKTRRNSFRLFFSYENKKYSSYGSFRINKFSCFENGGIINDSLIFDENYVSQGDFPVFLSGQGTPPHDKANVINSFKNLSAFLHQEINIFKNIDSNVIFNNIKFLNSFEINLYKRNFIDAYPSIGLGKNLIENLFFNDKNTFDSISYNNFSFNYGISFETIKFKYFITGISSFNNFFFFSKDQSRNSIYIPFYYSFKYFNNGLKSGLYFINKLFKVNSSLQYYFSGFEANSFNFHSSLELNLLKTNMSLNLEIQNNKPSFLYCKYFSNNYIWENNFDFEKKYIISITLSKPFLSLKFDNFLLANYIFFNDKSIPEQYNKNIVINSLTIENNLHIGKFIVLNNAVFQKSSNNQIINLPILIVNHSFSFNQPIKFNFTGGLLETSTGYEIKYFSSFYAQKYSPYISAFYQQNFKKIGNYPLINVFLQIKLKRFRFFLKYEHVNYKLFDREYFSGIGYPLIERTLKYGLSWHFYD